MSTSESEKIGTKWTKKQESEQAQIYAKTTVTSRSPVYDELHTKAPSSIFCHHQSAQLPTGTAVHRVAATDLARVKITWGGIHEWGHNL